MKIKIFILVILIMFLSRTVSLADENKTTYMDLAQCIQKALQVNPNLKSAVAKLNAYEAKLGEAVSAYLPRVSASGNYNRGVSASAGTSAAITHSNSDTASVSQLLYDFSRTPLNIAMSKETIKQYYFDTIDTTQKTLLKIITYYYNLLAKQEVLKVRQQNVETLKTSLKQAQGFYKAGFKSKIDVTTAEVNLSRGELQVIETRNDINIVRSQLANAVGLDNINGIEIQNIKGIPEFQPDLGEAHKLSLQLRPDYLKSKSQLQQAYLNIRWAGTTTLPSLSSNANYQWQGADYPLNRGWNMGLNLSWALYDGGYTMSLVKETKAALRDQEAQQLALEQNIYLSVDQSYSNYIKSKESLSVYKDTVEQAKENLDLAEGRYRVGVGDIVELTQAQLNYLSAQTDNISNILNYMVFKASLETAIGESLVNIYGSERGGN